MLERCSEIWGFSLCAKEIIENFSCSIQKTDNNFYRTVYSLRRQQSALTTYSFFFFISHGRPRLVRWIYLKDMVFHAALETGHMSVWKLSFITAQNGPHLHSRAHKANLQYEIVCSFLVASLFGETSHITLFHESQPKI